MFSSQIYIYIYVYCSPQCLGLPVSAEEDVRHADVKQEDRVKRMKPLQVMARAWAKLGMLGTHPNTCQKECQMECPG